MALAYEILKPTNIDVCTVIGFPFGANKAEIKAFEAIVAIEEGAVELDMVINIGALKSCSDSLVKKDIEGVVESTEGMVVKVIIETALLTNNEKISKKAGADYIKTSTGIGYLGANIPDIKLIKKTIGSTMGIKASGGIRNLNTALEMINAGATKIGTSTGPVIIKELEKTINKN